MNKHAANWVHDLVAGASDPAFAIDAGRGVIAWNRSAERLLGRSATAAIGRNCGTVLCATQPDGTRLCGDGCKGFACFVAAVPWRQTACILRHADGNAVPVGLSSMVIPPAQRRDSGDAVAIVFMHARATDRQAAPRQAAARQAPGMSALRLRTLGGFVARAGEVTLDAANWQRQHAFTLLKCLVCNRDRLLHRDRLMEWLWPEANPALAWPRLKVTVSFLRARLQDALGPNVVVETVGDCYRLASTAVGIDADVFEALAAEGRQRLKAGDAAGAKALLQQAEDLYRGDFFADDPYADWCATERERLREIRLDLLADLVQCSLATDDATGAARLCQRAIAVDPSRECFVRALMAALADLGQIEAARARFRAWQTALAREFDLQPMPETLAQYHALGRPRADDSIRDLPRQPSAARTGASRIHVTAV